MECWSSSPLKASGLVDEVAPAHLSNERSLLAALSAKEQTQLAGLLRKMLGRVRARTTNSTRPADAANEVAAASARLQRS